MSDVKQIKQQFLYDLAQRRKELECQLSAYAVEEQDLLHFLENEIYDAVVMVKIAKQLKISRLNRRKVKVELEQLQSIHDTVTKKKLKQFAEKHYEYRTDVLSNIASRTKGDRTQNHNIIKM